MRLYELDRWLEDDWKSRRCRASSSEQSSADKLGGVAADVVAAVAAGSPAEGAAESTTLEALAVTGDNLGLGSETSSDESVTEEGRKSIGRAADNDGPGTEDVARSG